MRYFAVLFLEDDLDDVFELPTAGEARAYVNGYSRGAGEYGGCGSSFVWPWDAEDIRQHKFGSKAIAAIEKSEAKP